MTMREFRQGVLLPVSAAFCIVSVTTVPVAAQGILASLFGSSPRAAPQDNVPPTGKPAAPLQLSTAAPPARAHTEPRGQGRGTRDVAGPFTTYCVRLCDGRYFPLARSHSIASAEQCRALCPAARTKVFGGSSIGQAAAADGSRYAELDTAFLYRRRVVDNCTCNGRDAFGIARVDLAADVTLRPGDIVARNDGFAAYTGAHAAKYQPAFAPIAQYPSVSAEVRRRLTQTKVLLAPPPQPVATTAAPQAAADRAKQAQLSR
jgi:hypothetical protein